MAPATVSGYRSRGGRHYAYSNGLTARRVKPARGRRPTHPRPPKHRSPSTRVILGSGAAPLIILKNVFPPHWGTAPAPLSGSHLKENDGGGLSAMYRHVIEDIEWLRDTSSKTYYGFEAASMPCNGHLSSCGLPPPAGFGLACRRASAAGDGLDQRAAWARRSSTRVALTAKTARRLAPKLCSRSC